MDRIEKTVFLSYRRTNVWLALAIFQNLTHHGFDVFFDYNGIASGDFEQVILGNIKARAHFLVLLTPSALERCHEPGDWLRREIETALQSLRNIVPLLLEDFDFRNPGIGNQLTGTLSALKNYNGLRIPHDYFDEGMERLRNRYLNVPLTSVLHPASVTARQAAAQQKAAASAALAVQVNESRPQVRGESGNAATDVDNQLRKFADVMWIEPSDAEAFTPRGNDDAHRPVSYLKAMGTLTGKEEVFAKLLFLINAPAQRLATVINATGRDLALALNQGVEKEKFAGSGVNHSFWPVSQKNCTNTFQ